MWYLGLGAKGRYEPVLMHQLWPRCTECHQPHPQTLGAPCPSCGAALPEPRAVHTERAKLTGMRMIWLGIGNAMIAFGEWLFSLARRI